MSKKKSYLSWCRGCKFNERNPCKCIACFAGLMSAGMEEPPEYMKKVKE